MSGRLIIKRKQKLPERLITAELEILQAIFKMVEIRHMYKDVGW